MTEPISTRDPATDSWANWVQAQLQAERDHTEKLLGKVVAMLRAEVPDIVRRLGVRGPRGEPGRDGASIVGPEGPRGKLPAVRAWMRETVYYQGDVATFDGGCYQAKHDTSEPPDNEAHWRCLVSPGRDARSPRVLNTYEAGTRYKALDIVSLNGGAFIARHDNPGVCPGNGWQMIAKQGPRGVAGERGPKGERGPPGPDAAIVGWRIDRAAFTATPVMTDGTNGVALNLRPLFEEFLEQVAG
jgi:hypothetical protein